MFEIGAAFPEMAANYGVLSGPAFSISYAIAGIFMGLLVGKTNRKNLLAAACILFSLTQIISGTTSSFAVMVGMRFILGLFVSVVEPVAFSLMGDYFPPQVRTFANSIIGTGAYVGNAAGAQLVNVVNSYGWRAAYYVKGGLGVFIGLLAFFLIKEPRRGLM